MHSTMMARSAERTTDAERAREWAMADAIDALCATWDPNAQGGDPVTPAMQSAYAALCRVSEDLINA